MNEKKEIISQKVKQEKEALRDEAANKIKQYIGAGFGIVAGLAWNDAIKSFIEYIFPLEKNSLAAKFIYALAMTLIVVVVAVSLTKIFKKEEK